MSLQNTLQYLGFAFDRDYITINGVITEWRSALPQPTPAEIAAAMPAAQAAYDAAEAQRLADKADRQELRDSFAQWRDTLQGVRDEAAWTNAKRDAALKDMARIQLKMLKILRDLAVP